MEAFDVTHDPVKKVGGWAAEKWSRLKFSGAGTMDPDYGNFMAVETLALGVLGKRSLWVTLREVGAGDARLEAFDLDELIRRADQQHEVLEEARILLSRTTLTAD